jgi:hypothetical protein
MSKVSVSSPDSGHLLSALVPPLALDRMGMNSPVLRMKPVNLHVETPAWLQHIPFAWWIVAQVRPRLLVELGTHAGNSYFAFCLAMRQIGMNGQAFAVDTWRGDEHAGAYNDEVFEKVDAINKQQFGSFSSLLRMTFDDALPRFKDGSIDLLHIDGLHTYEAVRHDFETWRPKMAADGVVLFHDTAEYGRGFGVHRLFAELARDYPHFEFKHSHGLGILSMSPQPRGDLGLMLRPAGWRESPLGFFRLRRERSIRRHFRDMGASLRA